MSEPRFMSLVSPVARPQTRLGAKRFLLIAVIASGTGGCAAHGAPSFVLFEAYFPAWLLLAAIGIFTAAAVHVAMVASGLAEAIRFQLLSCTAIGVTTAVLLWLIWFSR